MFLCIDYAIKPYKKAKNKRTNKNMFHHYHYFIQTHFSCIKKLHADRYKRNSQK